MKGKKDPKRCRANVHDDHGVDFHQCIRPPTKDGYCCQHHPTAVAARKAETKRRYTDQAKRQEMVHRIGVAEQKVLDKAAVWYVNLEARATSTPNHLSKLAEEIAKLMKLRVEKQVMVAKAMKTP